MTSYLKKNPPMASSSDTHQVISTVDEDQNFF